MKMKFLDYCMLCLVYVATSILAQDVCVMKTPCKCEFVNGTGVDLTPVPKTFYTTQVFSAENGGQRIDLTTYMYHPCVDALPVINGTMTTNTCNKPLSLCRTTESLVRNVTATPLDYIKEGAVCDYLGVSDQVVFSNDGRAIIYKNPPSENTVLLVCAETDGDLRVASLTDPQKVVLQFFTRYACMEQLEAPGRSVGSTLCIIFFSFVIVYLVLGVCTKKFLMGATGVEVIPNLGFWTDLPNLIKDGWAFALNGFKLPMRGGVPATSPDPNSYDSI